MSNFTKGAFLVTSAHLCWAIIEVLGNLIFSGGAGVITILSVRFLLASILFLTTIFLINKQWFVVKREDILELLLACFVLVTHIAAFWWGLKHLVDITAVVAIYYTFPFWAAILSVLFLKERFSRHKIISLFLGTIGVLFAVGFLPFFNLLGINILGATLMLLAAVTWAIYLLLSRQLLKRYHPFTILFYGFVLCFIVFSGLQSPLVTISQLSWPVLKYILVVAVVSTYLAFLLIELSLKYIRVSTASIIASIKPFFAILFAYLALKQTTTLFQLFGVGLTMYGIYLLGRGEKDNG